MRSSPQNVFVLWALGGDWQKVGDLPPQVAIAKQSVSYAYSALLTARLQVRDDCCPEEPRAFVRSRFVYLRLIEPNVYFTNLSAPSERLERMKSLTNQTLWTGPRYELSKLLPCREGDLPTARTELPNFSFRKRISSPWSKTCDALRITNSVIGCLNSLR